MITVKNSFYKDYENLLIKNDQLSEENRKLRYLQNLLEGQNNTLKEHEEKIKQELEEKQNLIEKQEYEIARLKALLNMDGKNHGIPTSQTPINKEKVIPNTREKSDKAKGGQIGHKKHKLEKFKDEEIKASSNACPSYFSWSFTNTPMIFEEFCARRIPAILGIY